MWMVFSWCVHLLIGFSFKINHECQSHSRTKVSNWNIKMGYCLISQPKTRLWLNLSPWHCRSDKFILYSFLQFLSSPQNNQMSFILCWIGFCYCHKSKMGPSFIQIINALCNENTPEGSLQLSSHKLTLLEISHYGSAIDCQFRGSLISII